MPPRRDNVSRLKITIFKFPLRTLGPLPISPGISHSPLASAQGSRRQQSHQRRRRILPREPKATFNYCFGLCNQTNWTHRLWDSSLSSENLPATSSEPLELTLRTSPVTGGTAHPMLPPMRLCELPEWPPLSEPHFPYLEAGL